MDTLSALTERDRDSMKWTMDFGPPKFYLLKARKGNYSAANVLTFMKNEGRLSLKVELRPMKYYNTPWPWDVIKEPQNCDGPVIALRFSFLPFFEQACVDQLSYTCDSIVFWVCGEQITCFFGSTDYMLRATVLKKLYLRVYSTGDSSISTADLDNAILDLELMLSVMHETFGGLGWGRCILLAGAMWINLWPEIRQWLQKFFDTFPFNRWSIVYLPLGVGWTN